MVVAPNRAPKQVIFNKQTLSKIANRSKSLAEIFQNNTKTMIEEERKQEERYLSFRKGEAEKNRQYELLIAQVFANTLQSQF